MNIALIYMLAALLAIIVAAPVALLAPIFFAVTIGLPAETMTADIGAEETIIEQGDVQTETLPLSCAPFVKVYAARGESRPAVYAWSLCAATPTPAYFLSKAGKGLRGAPLASAKRKASRTLCVSHACPTVRL